MSPITVVGIVLVNSFACSAVTAAIVVIGDRVLMPAMADARKEGSQRETPGIKTKKKIEMKKTFAKLLKSRQDYTTNKQLKAATQQARDACHTIAHFATTFTLVVVSRRFCGATSRQHQHPPPRFCAVTESTNQSCNFEVW